MPIRHDLIVVRHETPLTQMEKAKTMPILSLHSTAFVPERPGGRLSCLFHIFFVQARCGLSRCLNEHHKKEVVKCQEICDNFFRSGFKTVNRV